jgi:CheY-like chemotaxis protein
MTAPRILRVLTLDDNRDTADSLAWVLRLWGHEAVVAYDAETALALALHVRPHVAFLDLKLARSSGQELARCLRDQPTLRGMVLVAVTGLNSAADLRWAKDCGVDFVFRKPVDPEELHALLGRLALPRGLPGTRPTLRMFAPRQSDQTS